MTPLRRRLILSQQMQNKQRGKPLIASVHDQFMVACVRCNEARFLELVGRVRLIGSVATVNQTDACGRTPLSHLCGHGSGRCVEEFARLKLADVNLADRDGNTPLHFAAQAGHARVVAALLGRFDGIEVDARNRLGITPLMKSCVCGRESCAKLLLDNGADPLARNPRRQLTAAQWAYMCGWPACARVVETHMLATGHHPDSEHSADHGADHGAGHGADHSGGHGSHQLARCGSEPALRREPSSAWLERHYRAVVGGAWRGRRASLPDRPATCRPAEPATWRTDSLPQICVVEVEAPVDPLVVQYGDPLPPEQLPRQPNQVASLCLPGMGKGFAYE